LNKQNQADLGLQRRQVAGRNYTQIDGAWIDEDVKKDGDVVNVRFASKAYFEIYRNASSLQRPFELGDELILQVGRYCLVIDDNGIEDAADSQVQSLIAEARKL
jgi:hypothetical protein